MPRARVRSLGPAGKVLVNGETGVDAAAVQKIGPHRGAGAFGCRQDHVHIFRGDNAGLVAVNDAETVGEVQGVAFVEAIFNGRPHGYLAGVGEQVLDHGGLAGRLLDGQKGLSRYETVGHGLVPGGGPFPLSDNYGDSVVAHVQCLARPPARRSRARPPFRFPSTSRAR